MAQGRCSYQRHQHHHRSAQHVDALQSGLTLLRTEKETRGADRLELKDVGDGFYHYHRSWNDDLSMPFACIPGYIARVKAGETLVRPFEKLHAERRELIAGYRELLNSEEERQAYDQMITLAHRVFPYVEGHKFYCEHWYTNLFFNKIREFGALLAQHGFFADAEDVFQATFLVLVRQARSIRRKESVGSWLYGVAQRIGLRARAQIAERHNQFDQSAG